jgi:hypothetical protein
VPASLKSTSGVLTACGRDEVPNFAKDYLIGRVL